MTINVSPLVVALRMADCAALGAKFGVKPTEVPKSTPTFPRAASVPVLVRNGVVVPVGPFTPQQSVKMPRIPVGISPRENRGSQPGVMRFTKRQCHRRVRHSEVQ
jgi:hypothetical protein